MSREREAAGELANEAERALERWSGKMSDGEKKLLEEAVGSLRDVLGEKRKGAEADGLKGLREKVEELIKVCLVCHFWRSYFPQRSTKATSNAAVENRTKTMARNRSRRTGCTQSHSSSLYLLTKSHAGNDPPPNARNPGTACLG